MILYDKTEEELNSRAIEFLKNTDITNINTPGSRAKLVLGAINKVLRTYYSTLDFNITMAFVSKANGEFLDFIGELLNCTREFNESDDNYRYRITNQVYVVAGANETAVRLSALAVDDVVDILPTPYTFGTGSFSVHVITNSLDNLASTVIEVQKALNEVEAYGIKGIALAPKILPVKVGLALAFSSDVLPADRVSIGNQTKKAVKKLIDTLPMGGELVLSDLVYAARDLGERKVYDASVVSLFVKNKATLLSNYRPYWDEKLYVKNEDDVSIV